MALPGGRAAPGDEDDAATAARETLEEVGIDLRARGRLLGPLDVLTPMSEGAPRITVAPFVFAVPAGTGAEPNEEVSLAIWVTLTELSEPGAAAEYLHEMGDGTVMAFPAYGAGLGKHPHRLPWPVLHGGRRGAAPRRHAVMPAQERTCARFQP
jgi:ADP-ribose pyrophosphatase YjhB (NUDIX family)